MLLEDYFEFLSPEDIRIKGHRIGIETILYEYIYHQRTAEEIAKIYTSLTLEQVYATILYYLHNKKSVGKYLADWLEWSHQQLQKSRLNPHPSATKLQKIKEQKKAELCR